MADEQKHEDSQKTLVAFVVGLLIGGMLVWAFTGSDDRGRDAKDNDEATMATTTDDENEDEDENADNEDNDTQARRLNVGEGKIEVDDQKAGRTVGIKSAELPVKEGWIGVRQYNNDTLGKVLGVYRFSESQNRVPEEIELVTSTTPGNTYAIVVYEEDGDFDFDLAKDKQLETVYDTFKAQ